MKEKLYLVQWQGKGIHDWCGDVIPRYYSFNWGQFHQTRPLKLSTAKKYAAKLKKAYPDRWVKILEIPKEEAYKYVRK